jgi:GNAT superfamily N-acetyltransferase
MARPGDAASFMDLFGAVVAERRFVRSDAVRRSLSHYRRRFRHGWTEDQASLVAVVGQHVVGHLGLVREDSPENRHVATLGMAVARQWRGRGVGSALMAEAIRWAREFGVETLALYRKFGFREEGRLRGHSKKSIGYRDELIMGLWVDGPPPGVGT